MKSRALTVLSEYCVALVGVLLFFGALEKHSLYEGAVVMVTGGMLIILSLGIGKTLKRIIQKARPSGAGGTYAFPSSHATGMASITYYLFTESQNLGVASLVLTLAVTYARIKTSRHDLLDIIGGLFLGALIAYLATPYIWEYARGFFLPTFLFA